ncbi:MAG: [FeFe] hydrogenase, group A, partial [Negativicutes bacterium]|nr:[FeFe] hydrogenase, group A [Negativicutes bacterium]
SLIRDQSKCVLCGRCIRACSERQGMDIYAFTKRGFNTMVTSAFDRGLDQTDCTYCGQCSSVCPTGAIVDRDDTRLVWKALADPDKHVVVQTAPAVRVCLGEEFGLEPGSIVTGQMVSALRKLGFDKVFDTDFTADLTIIEEGSEFIKRFTEGKGKMPMITSCSPGWVNFAESQFPDLLDHLSSAKSPQAMFGTLSKTYYAEKTGIDPKNIVSVSIMPCTAKKDECRRPQLSGPYGQDVDIVLTTREIARMIKEAGIDLLHCDHEDYDAPFGLTTGAGVIFGATGGVLEAALRTVAFLVTGEELPSPDMVDVRGLAGIREHTYTLKLKPEFAAKLGKDQVQVRVAVVHTLSIARKVMEMIREGKAPYDLIEVMACPGGCIGGGGQPTPTNAETRRKRIEGIYRVDANLPLRKSHQNPAIWELYNTWLGEPLGEKSHHYLHTHYTPQRHHQR